MGLSLFFLCFRVFVVNLLQKVLSSTCSSVFYRRPIDAYVVIDLLRQVVVLGFSRW